MAWIYRVIEDDEGGWACRFGRTEFDRHATLADALTHIEVLAAAVECDDILVHHQSGTVERRVRTSLRDNSS